MIEARFPAKDDTFAFSHDGKRKNCAPSEKVVAVPGVCPMAESGQKGMVNHAGQVFEGD